MSRLIQWESVCLVCLQKGEIRSIFGKDNDSIMIADKIMKYSDILIKGDTNQPKSICLQCLDDLSVTSKFHRNYEQSESIIKAILNTNHQEIPIKDLRKTSPTTVNPILDICIKDEVVDNTTVDDICENTPCLNLEDNAGTESKPIVEDRADSHVHSNDKALSNVKSDQRNKTKQKKNCKISGRSRGRLKKLSEVFRTNPKQIVDTSESIPGVDLKDHPDTKPKIVVEDRADSYDHSNTTEQSNMKTGQNNKSKQKMNSKIPNRSKGQPKKLSEESSLTSGYNKPLKRPRFRPRQSTGITLKICEICSHGFRYQTALDNHMRRHNNERPFSCNQCDKAFVARGDLRRHVRVHTGEKPYKCQYCDLRFADTNVRQNHESKHTGQKPYKCPTCEKSFGYYKGLMWHLRIHNGENKFTCKECGKEYRRKKLFQKHVNRHLNCDELNKSSEHAQKTSLEKEIFQIEENTNLNEISIKHEIVEDNLFSDNSDVESTPCIDQEYGTVAEASNGEIPKQLTGVSLKICEICNHDFRNQSALDVHMRRHNNERPFSCDHCDKAFVTSSALRCHMRVHTGEKPYKCQYCHLRFADTNVRQNHESKHTGEKPFKCPTCDKSFGYSKGLMKHLRIHNKFSCKEFRREKLIQKHVKRHLNRDEVNKSSEHTQTKLLHKEILQIQGRTNSNEIDIKHEILEDHLIGDNSNIGSTPCIDIDNGPVSEATNRVIA